MSSQRRVPEYRSYLREDLSHTKNVYLTARFKERKKKSLKKVGYYFFPPDTPHLKSVQRQRQYNHSFAHQSLKHTLQDFSVLLGEAHLGKQ